MEMALVPPSDRSAAEARIIGALRDHAEAQGHGFRRVAFALESRDGDLWQGGLSGFLGKDWLYIELLAVAETARGQGVGQALVARAEAVALTHGLSGLWVDTYSFQAPGFYERLGFTECGRIADQPLGQSRLFFQKRLSPDPRRLIPGDPALGPALALVRDAFAYMDGIVDPPSSIHLMTAEAYADAARRGEVWALGNPVAAAMTVTPKDDCLYLGKLAVAAERRGQGLARRMVDLALARARIHGKAWLELQTRVELVGNQAVFQAMGFAEVARTAHSGYDRPTSITYRRKVEPLT